MRLIDANAFLRLLSERCFDFFEVNHTKEWRITTTGDVGYYAKTISVLLDKTPTIDAVEVVRCKDCRHFLKKHIDRGYCGMEGSGGFPQTSWAITDFCSYGERRTDNG